VPVPRLVLGVESSCDEMAAAVVRDGRAVLASCVRSQLELHRPYGGVVPELASRDHVRSVSQVVRSALDAADVRERDLDAIAVTMGPGLLGSLLVGLSFAKALAYRLGIPVVGVHHLAGHLAAAELAAPGLVRPYLGLVVSGGHTALYRVEDLAAPKLLGETSDDAVGEAFDKVAVLLGLGYPGGPPIEAAARAGRVDAWSFPRAWLRPGSLDVSLSGLKTAVRRTVDAERAKRGLAEGEALPPGMAADMAASFQEAVIEVLAARLGEALRVTGAPRAVVAGGVAANGALRERAALVCRELGVTLHLPPGRYCGDNAAMIAAVGASRLRRGERAGLSVTPEPELSRLGL
jgi:N6-L-threonylcarbamoyladenine synthase